MDDLFGEPTEALRLNVLDNQDIEERNRIEGTPGADRLEGTELDDLILGLDGRDEIRGGNGNDVIVSGAGYLDIMYGQGGSDIFVFGEEASNGRYEIDIIRDYEVGVDKIGLNGAEILRSSVVGDRTVLRLDGSDRDIIIVHGAKGLDEISFVTGRPNDPPVAQDDDGYAAQQNSELRIPVSGLLANDTDPNGDELAVANVFNPIGGTVELDGKGTVETDDDEAVFTVSEDFTGEASFDYTVTDGELTDTATVHIKVEESSVVNFEAIPGSPLSINLPDFFKGLPNPAFTLFSDDNLPEGRIGSDGRLTFNPSPDEIGEFQFDITALSNGASETRSFTLSILADNTGTTRVSGIILNTKSEPLAGIRIVLDTDETTTDENGRFTILVSDDIEDNRILVLAGEVEGSVYPSIAEPLPLLLMRDEVFPGFDNVIDRPIFLPELDLANAVTIDPDADTLVETETIPGASVFVAANTLTNQEGQPFTGRLSITEVPRELTPAALPPNLLPDLVVTIQPGEMQFGQPAPLSLPNTCNLAPGTELDLWSINPDTGEFDLVGLGRVSADGSVIETVEGGILNSSWHFFTPPAPEPQDTEENDKNPPENECLSCDCSVPGSSEVILHSGAVIEQHNLVTYQSEGETRGLRFVYDSLRADPSYILHFGYDNAQANDTTRLVADLVIKDGNFERQVQGAPAGFGLEAGSHFWKVPEGGGDIEAAIQAPMETFATGRYDYELTTGLLCFTGTSFTGATTSQTGSFNIINTMDSPFGAGWGIAGLHL